MSACPTTAPSLPVLASSEGELVSVRISIEPRLLEETLEALAEVPFPVNPEICHGWPTIVEFPAYRSRLAEVRAVLQRNRIPTRTVEVSRMLDTILT
ncbi:MAG TPA: hypothetical protein VFL57_14560 [Bryobacteraceae bacterium]|nr:hypothetical protein [Bryobacteraceae bacterium]